MTVYTWGYMRAGAPRSAWPVAELERLQQERNALIVDTLQAVEPFRAMETAFLQRRFVDDCLWIQAFGNVNRAAKSIVLADPAAGLTQLKPLVSENRPPLLL